MLNIQVYRRALQITMSLLMNVIIQTAIIIFSIDKNLIEMCDECPIIILLYGISLIVIIIYIHIK